MEAVLAISLRWLHLMSAIVLLGGVFYVRVAAGEMAATFKPWVYGAIGGILISGVYNFLSKSSTSTNYQVWLGIKVLLALHIFASAILYRGKKRSLAIIIIFGAAIVAISGYLRWISLAI
ncbi:MAG TPA: hypothetical protein VKV74_07645 [Bryobacteraceae bacterium]|nr:hypothetical protein [Bryobacteraceae bacterium]